MQLNILLYLPKNPQFLKETCQPFDSGLPQSSPASPVLSLIYAQVMPESTKSNGKEDVSYLDNDGLLQLGRNRKFILIRLRERMEKRIERGKQLNFSYESTNSSMLHFHYRNDRNGEISNNPVTGTHYRIAQTRIPS